MASRWRTRVLLSAVLAMFACEVDDGASSLEVTVRAEPPMQVSTSFPAQLLVGFDSSGSGYLVFRVGFLCAPDAPFFTTATFSAPGAGATAVDAWLVPVQGGSPFACGPLATPQPVPWPGWRARRRSAHERSHRGPRRVRHRRRALGHARHRAVALNAR